MVHLTLTDALGPTGVAMMLVAYAGAQARRLDPVKAPALLMNLAGACLVMLSLTHDFNLAAFLMEACWAAVAAYGLVRTTITRR
jgi:Na+/phosphate symporter